MTEQHEILLQWLRVEMLRLQSFDWVNGVWKIQELKDGVIKFTSFYTLDSLSKELGVSENDILTFIDSDSSINEISTKSFTVSYTGEGINLTWLEPGIKQLKTEVSRDFIEEKGRYFVTTRWIHKIVYINNRELTIRDSGAMGPHEITKQEFLSGGGQAEKDLRP